jgi:hypothetical protein
MWCSIREGNWKRGCTWRKGTITNASGSVQSKQLLPLPHFHAQLHTPRSKLTFPGALACTISSPSSSSLIYISSTASSLQIASRKQARRDYLQSRKK